MNVRKIMIGVSALAACVVLVSVIIIAVMPPVYQSKTVTMMDGSTGFVVLCDHQAFAVNTHPDRAAPRVDLIGDFTLWNNAINIEAPAAMFPCTSMEGQMHWNRIDWTIKLGAMHPPEYLTDQRVFMPWSVIAISTQIHKFSKETCVATRLPSCCKPDW